MKAQLLSFKEEHQRARVVQLLVAKPVQYEWTVPDPGPPAKVHPKRILLSKIWNQVSVHEEKATLLLLAWAVSLKRQGCISERLSFTVSDSDKRMSSVSLHSGS